MNTISTGLEMSELFSGIANLFTTTTLLLLLLPFTGVLILKLAAKWNILEKAGEPGWIAIIPFYGNYMYYDITWDNGLFFLLSYIPGVSYAADIITKVKLSARFDKDSWFTLGLVLFEPVFLAILGFDDSEFNA